MATDLITQIQVKRGTWDQFKAKQATTPLLDGEIGLITDKGIFVAGYNGGYFQSSVALLGKLSQRPEATAAAPGALYVEESETEEGVQTGKVYINSGIAWIDISNAQDLTDLIDDSLAGDADGANLKVWSIQKVSQEIKKVKTEIALERDWKDSVVVATTQNVSPLSGLIEVDGITVKAGNRVLVKNQTTVSENGIYVAGEGAWEKAADASVLTPGAAVTVEDGTQKNNAYILSKDLTTWVKFSDGNYGAGNGLEKTGNIFSVKSDDVSAGVVPVNVTADGVSTKINADTLLKDTDGSLKVHLGSQFTATEANGIAVIEINGGTF